MSCAKVTLLGRTQLAMDDGVLADDVDDDAGRNASFFKLCNKPQRITMTHDNFETVYECMCHDKNRSELRF